MRFIPHELQREHETTVLVDPKKLDAAHRADDPGYAVHPDGKNAVKGRVEGIAEFLKKGQPLQASRMAFDDDGKIYALDGRHRLRHLADIGAGLHAVTVPKEQEIEFKRRFGNAGPADGSAAAAWLGAWDKGQPAKPIVREYAERADFALPGSDGAKAVDLLGSVQSAGIETLANLCRRAVTRLLADPNAAGATTLFDDSELADLRDSISSALAAGDLLGRARVRRLADLASDRQDFAEPVNPFDVFADPLPSLLPRAAISFFQRLIPSLSVDPERYGPLMERHAFTMAHAADQVILGKVKETIAAMLAGTPSEIPGTAAVVGDAQPERGPEAVERILREAGVSPRNPQYAEMVYRTNLMDSYQAGVHAELATPEMQEMFPVWQYLGIRDGRQGEDHEPKFDKYYPSSASFAEVRGDRPFNCRCSSRPVSKFEWKRLQARGAAAETSW